MDWPPDERPEYIGYQEFACSEKLARELLAGGMTHVNERPVWLQHMDTMGDGRWIMHVWQGRPIGASVTSLVESPGTIALPTGEVGPFAEFTLALAGTEKPDGCHLDASYASSVTVNLNLIFGRLREEDRWCWVIGNDHTWPGTALMEMLRTMDEHPEIDVLVPLCVKRNPPWNLVLFDQLDAFDQDGTPLFEPIPWERVPESGVFEVDAAGSAGMLIRRHVIDELEPPWWYSTMDWHGRQVVTNEDVTFCTRIRKHHNFRIFATADVAIGHLGIVNVRPGRFGPITEFSTMDNNSRHTFTPIEELARV